MQPAGRTKGSLRGTYSLLGSHSSSPFPAFPTGTALPGCSAPGRALADAPVLRHRHRCRPAPAPAAHITGLTLTPAGGGSDGGPGSAWDCGAQKDSHVSVLSASSFGAPGLGEALRGLCSLFGSDSALLPVTLISRSPSEGVSARAALALCKGDAGAVEGLAEPWRRRGGESSSRVGSGSFLPLKHPRSPW